MSSKPTNPKDAIGSNKVPLHLFPHTATVAGAMALLHGAMKYGRSNWRAVGVRKSIYFDALMRHMAADFEGEELDAESGLPHTWHALACLAILIDAKAAGKLNDDSQYPGGFRAMLDAANADVPRLKATAKDGVKHYMKGVQ